MPTARELLEQADALMRRDRDALATGGRARPSSTPITTTPRPLAGTVVSPRTIQREPIAPSVARTALPVHPTDSPAFAAAEAPPVTTVPEVRETALPTAPAPAAAMQRDESAGPLAEVASADDADFPMLTDAVVVVVEAEDGADAADVPLLTDAVGSIGAVEVDEIARGEASLWDIAARGERSVLGQAPDSVVVVPAPEYVPIAPPPGRDPLGLDQPAPGFLAPPSSLAPREQAPEPATLPAATAAAQSDEASTAEPPSGSTLGQESVPVAAPAAHETALEWVTEAPMAGAAVAPAGDASHAAAMAMPPLHGGGGALAGFAPLRPQPGYAVAEPFADSDVAAPDVAGAAEASAAGAPSQAMPIAPGAAAPDTDAASTLDDARIAEAVDEIRMQVLQRIDIFTDTTLRAKLGEQLQPLVERASADLVAAINQHVGTLLRTYVAEALEQEIERWRNGQR
jgi:hypothetical protein